MTSANVPLFEVYAQALCEHAHVLFENGYARMDASDFCSAEEPAITGQLVAEMQAFLECPEAPEWAIH